MKEVKFLDLNIDDEFYCIFLGNITKCKKIDKNNAVKNDGDIIFLVNHEKNIFVDDRIDNDKKLTMVLTSITSMICKELLDIADMNNYQQLENKEFEKWQGLRKALLLVIQHLPEEHRQNYDYWFKD